MNNCYNFSLGHKFNKVRALIDEGRLNEARRVFESHVRSKFDKEPSHAKVLKLLTYCNKMTNEMFDWYKLQYKYIIIGKLKINGYNVVILYSKETLESIAETTMINNGESYSFILTMGHDDPASYMHEISHIFNDPNNIELLNQHKSIGKSLHETGPGQKYEALMDINGINLCRSLLSYNLSLESRLDYLMAEYEKIDQDMRYIEPHRYRVLIQEVNKQRKLLGLQPRLFSKNNDSLIFNNDNITFINID